MNKHILMLGMFFLLVLASVSSAQTVQKTLESVIFPEVSGNVINVSLVTFESGQPSTAVADLKNQMTSIISKCQKAHTDGAAVQSCIINESRTISQTAEYPVRYSSVEGANFSFSYWNAFKPGGPGLVPIAGCKRQPANQKTIRYNATGDAMDYWVATCNVSPEIYQDRKIMVTISYIPASGEDIDVSVAKVELSNATTNIKFIGYLKSAIEGALSGTSTTVATPMGTLPCLGAFLILGLLLASMYFAGKSPITLLDITTPRLPSPKGFVAGGQILAPFGYTEMKRTTKRKMAAAALLAGKLFSIDKASVSASRLSLINQLAGRIKDAEAASVFKQVAVLHLKHGGKISDLQAIAKPFAQMSEGDHATYRQILNKLERVGGRTAMYAKVAADHRLSEDLMKSLDMLTYKGGKVTGKVQKVVGKLYGVDRYALLGPIVTGSLDSMLRSTSKLKDLAKASVVHGKQFAREGGKWAVETVGGKSGMKRLEKRSPWLYGELTKEGKSRKIGDFMPITQRMDHLHSALHEGLHRDQIRYLLKQLYRQMGVNTAALTDEVLKDLASKNINLIKLAGYKSSARMGAMEAEIVAILSSKSLSITEKKGKLEALLQSLGGSLDTNYIKMRERLEAIATDPTDGHVKLISLIAELDRENNALQAAKEGESRNDNKYYSLVGRGSLRGSDLMEVALFMEMIHDIENGHASRDVNLGNFLNKMYVQLENEYRTLDARNNLGLLPEFMRDRNVADQKVEAIRKALADNLTVEGERVLKELTGKTKNNASIDDFMKILQGADYMLKSQGIKKDEKYGVHVDPKTGHTMFYEDDTAIGPIAGLWKTYMKGKWTGGIDTRDLGQSGTHTEATFTRSYVTPDDPGIRATIDRYAGARTWSPEKKQMKMKELWVYEDIQRRMHNNFNDRYTMNAYGGTTNETMRYYSGIAANILLKSLKDHGFEARHTDVQFLKKFNVDSAKDMERLKYMLGERYKKQFAETLKRGVTMRDITSADHPWLQGYNGSYAPLPDGGKINGPVGDTDRILGGHVALRDDKGMLRQFIPDDVMIKFKGRDDLMHGFNEVAGTDDKSKWKAFINRVDHWADNGGVYSYEKEKVRAAVYWRQGHDTYDYRSYWQKSAVQLVPRNATMPLALSMLRSFGVEAPGLMKTMKPLKDFFQMMGQYAVNTMTDGAGARYIANFDGAPKSNLLKIHSWRMSTQIMTTDWNDMLKDITSDYDRKQVATAYRSVGLMHGQWAQVQAFTWDRNPWGFSTSHGAHQGWASAFNAGPAQPIPLRANLRAYMSAPEYYNYMATYGWPALIARKAIMPIQKAVAGAQRSMQGYSPRWHGSQDPMRWAGNYTPPRLLEAMRFLNPMSYSWGRGYISRKIESMNKYQSRAEKAQLTGYDHQLGLKQCYSDIHMISKGANAIARDGLANPNASVMDTRFNEQLASSMAEYLMMRSGRMAGYYRNDPYVKRMALTDTIRRTVSAEALAMKRQQELMGFGIMQNTMFTWFSPLSMAYHLGVPGVPQALSPRELINAAGNRFRRGYSQGGNIRQSLTSLMQNTGRAMYRAFNPRMASMQKYCRRCNTPGMSPGVCIKCGNHV